MVKRCPQCQNHECRIERSVTNLIIVLYNAALYPFIFLLVAISRGGLGFLAEHVFVMLVRQYPECGQRFRRKPWRYSRLKCASCHYVLIGNTSGVCPECGWALRPEHLEAVAAEGRRKKDDGHAMINWSH